MSVVVEPEFEMKEEKVKDGVTISRPLFSTLIVGTFLVFSAVIIGLSIGLKQAYKTDCNSATFTTQTIVKTTEGSSSPKNYRLPKNLRPYSYELTVTIDFDKFTEPNTFDGVVSVFFSCIGRTTYIALHKKNIDIDEETIVIRELVSNRTITVTKFLYDEEIEIMKLELASFLEDGQNYSLSMNYLAYAEANNFGFYKSFYIDSEGKKRWLVTSQMESTEARSAFPCFDEPSMKATFKLSVLHNPELTAISNMPSKTVFIRSDLTRTDFEPTVKMSTYLVALIISDFKCLNQTVLNTGEYGHVDVRVCGTSNAVDNHLLDYSLQSATKLIKYYEDFYGVKYPLPKCDHVAVPDFDEGAMENWGLIIYRDSILLYDPQTTSNFDKQFNVIAIAHELAHMWFGNMVTMEWWNDIWLNEGFATYVEYVGSDEVEKDFEMFEQFVERVFSIFEIDSIGNSRAISVNEEDVNTPDDISALYDQITYGKGGCLIRMMNYALGRNTFSKGIKNYLNNNKFGNTVREVVYAELDKAALEDGKLAGLNLTEIMNTWTRQMGHPLISIERLDANRIRISQKQFLLDPYSPPTEISAYNYNWFVPFTYTVEQVGLESTEAFSVSIDNLYDKTIWMRQTEKNKTIELYKPLNSEGGYILANLDVAGFYRVNYDSQSWNNIVQQLTSNKNAIPTRNRAQLIYDAFGLSQAGILESTRPFEIIKYLSKETEYLPWIAAIKSLAFFTNILESTPSYGNYQKFVINLISSSYENLGWEEINTEGWLQKSLRTSVLLTACEQDFISCVNISKRWLSEWMINEDKNPDKKGTFPLMRLIFYEDLSMRKIDRRLKMYKMFSFYFDRIPGNFRSFIYCTAIRNGGDKEWTFLSDQYEKEISANQRDYLQTGMSCTKQPWLISRYLNDQINSSKVRLQDAPYGFTKIAVTGSGNLRTWTFVKDNWNYLVSKISMNNIVETLASKFNTDTQLEEFERFFETHENQGDAARGIKSSIDKIKANLRWMKSGFKILSDWLANY